MMLGELKTNGSITERDAEAKSSGEGSRHQLLRRV
jgi:hypothetical protein